MGAAYQWDFPVTDDESFGFTLELKATDGSSLAWGEYTFEYSLQGCGADYLLTEGNGLSIAPELDLISFSLPASQRLRPGQYQHGFRYTNKATDFTIQQFVGTVTVSEGNF